VNVYAESSAVLAWLLGEATVASARCSGVRILCWPPISYSL
jgi:hypothetical protein